MKNRTHKFYHRNLFKEQFSNELHVWDRLFLIVRVFLFVTRRFLVLANQLFRGGGGGGGYLGGAGECAWEADGTKGERGDAGLTDRTEGERGEARLADGAKGRERGDAGLTDKTEGERGEEGLTDRAKGGGGGTLPLKIGDELDDLDDDEEEGESSGESIPFLDLGVSCVPAGTVSPVLKA